MKTKKKAIELELPAGLIRWANAEAKRRGASLSDLVELLMEREKDGGACVDVDVIEFEDGTFQIDTFPDNKTPGKKILGATRSEAIAKLEADMNRNRKEWSEWRINRALRVPGYGRTNWERVELRPSSSRMVSLGSWDWNSPSKSRRPERRK